jgi:hypothetical protein
MQMEDQIAKELIRLAEYDLQVREKLKISWISDDIK